MVILDKIINDLKAKIPFGKKGSEADESEDINEEESSSHQDDETDATDISGMDIHDEEDDLPENASIVERLKSKIHSLQKKPKGTKENKDKKGNERKIKPIYVLIGIGLLVILFSDEIFPPEPAPVTSFKKPNRKKNPPKTTDTASETIPTETAPVEEPPTEIAPVETAPTEVSATEVAPTEKIPDEPIKTEATTPGEVTTTETPDSSPVDVTSTETIPTETIETSPTENASDTGVTTSTDSIDGEVVPGDEENVTDQILQDLEKQAKSSQVTETKKEYIAPPDYEYTGRGLVYNCAGKHWACIDGPSYKTCEENSSSTKFLNKTTECYPFNVYETTKGCQNMQNRMVSSSAKTSFCSE